jgi:hypothetical protein
MTELSTTFEPNRHLTLAKDGKPSPDTVTTVPPASRPLLGHTLVILTGSKYEYTEDPSQSEPPFTSFTLTSDPALEVGDEHRAREEVKTVAGLLISPKKHQDLSEPPVKPDP